MSERRNWAGLPPDKRCGTCGYMKPPDCWKCPHIVQAQAEGRAIREAMGGEPRAVVEPVEGEQLDLFADEAIA